MTRNRLLLTFAFVLSVSIGGITALASDQIPGRFTGKEQCYAAAIDSNLVSRYGAWAESGFRYGANSHLLTAEDGASLEYSFTGTGLVILLDNHHTPEYAEPNLGRLVVTVDDGKPEVIYPQNSPLEVTVARDLNPGIHSMRLVHHKNSGQSGCRIIGFRSLSEPVGDLEFTVNGEENTFLVNSRAVLRRGARVVRNTLVRNRLNGSCRMAGLAPGDGYELEVSAIGWSTVRIANLCINDQQKTVLDPIYLQREERARNRRLTKNPIHWPRLGHPVIRKPGEKFRVRVACHYNELTSVTLRKKVGPAVICRQVSFTEHRELKFYYDHEMTVRIPRDIPAGLYDLIVTISSPATGQSKTTISPQCVYLVQEFPQNPVFITFGHLDTSGQLQAEYLRRMAQMANLIAPDMVLVSNAVNPAYVSGALSELSMPYLITFGNHQVPGNQYWYGDAVGITDFGPECVILNFGPQWHDDLSRAHALLTSRERVPLKIINTFEQNAPVEDFLDRYNVAMLHDAHGTGVKVMEIGTTPTVRVGKVNSYSFRVVRFLNNRVVSCTYKSDETAPYPFPRENQAPVRAVFYPANDGTHSCVTATVINELEEDFPKGRVTFVLPQGKYKVDEGEVVSSCKSDDSKYVVISVRTDIPAQKQISLTARAE
jgi:hypothetical protein